MYTARTADRIGCLLALWLCLAIRGDAGPQAGPPATTAPPQEGEVVVTQIAPKYHLISIENANLLLFVGRESSFAAGVQHPLLVAEAKRVVDRIGGAPVRHVLALDGENAANDGDGGWTGAGVVVMAHENLAGRMMHARSARPAVTPARAGPSSPRVPELGFSQVVQIRTGDEEIHIIHHRAGYTDADLILHYENSNVVYLGNTFTADGYPAIETGRGGDLDGMIVTVEEFVQRATNSSSPMLIVPGRGRPASKQELQAYRDMLVAIRQRVRDQIEQGRTLDQVLASSPTASFDAAWGRGPVSPERFTRMVYRSLTRTHKSPTHAAH